MTGRSTRKPIVHGPGEGRRYDMGQLNAIFKADGSETNDGYSISEWWMDPGFNGVGAHSHDDSDEVFYVISGKAMVLLGDEWLECEAGTFVRVPAKVTHDFRNTSDERAGLLNLFIPGGFEADMPSIVEWFAKDNTQG